MIKDGVMIINSDFKDYYDYLLRQYRDPKLVWDRREEEMGIREAPQDLLEIVNKYWCWRRYEQKYSYSVVLFAGQIIPFRVEYDRYTYKHTVDFKEPYKDLPKRWWGGEAVQRVNKIERSDKIMELNRNYSPIILLWGERIILNAQLITRGIKLPLDVNQIMIDLSACVAPLEPLIPEINDVDLAEAKGFNKHSFKKGKDERRRKGKKHA